MGPLSKAAAHSSPRILEDRGPGRADRAAPGTSLTWWCSSGARRLPASSPHLSVSSRCCTVQRRAGGASSICTDDTTTPCFRLSDCAAECVCALPVWRRQCHLVSGSVLMVRHRD
ncbi:hypothetical protein INR49_014470 [Caranx melampygus]|nr:hypothetical protein INR49_014470 [Caranx melampygus]